MCPGAERQESWGTTAVWRGWCRSVGGMGEITSKGGPEGTRIGGPENGILGFKEKQPDFLL